MRSAGNAGCFRCSYALKAKCHRDPSRAQRFYRACALHPKADCARASLLRILKHAAAGLVAESSCEDELPQFGAWEVLRLAEFAVQHHHDVVADIEPDEIGE